MIWGNFSSPFDLVNDSVLNYEQKIILLKDWAWDIQKELVAEYENMESLNGRACRLMDEIESALAFLRYKSDAV